MSHAVLPKPRNASGIKPAKVLLEATKLFDEEDVYELVEEKGRFLLKVQNEVIFSDGIAEPVRIKKITSKETGVTIFLCELDDGKVFQMGIVGPDGVDTGTEQWVSEEQAQKKLDEEGGDCSISNR